MQLTKNLKNLIEKAIEQTGGTDKYKLCLYVCIEMEKRYGDKLEEKLEKMGVPSTAKIIEAIDTYLKERVNVA